jgi:RNase H-fold protein (predicted Holliday junction resolvase)
MARPGGESALLAHIEGVLADRDVSVLLVGLPANMDGSEGPRASSVARVRAEARVAFPGARGRALRRATDDQGRRRPPREAGVPVSKRRERRDGAAALVLLRDWIASGEPR